MKLIVGLGNIGKEYEATRHNIGFMVIDELARRWGVSSWKTDRNAMCGEYRSPEKVLLLKPTTYMNLSGVAVGAYANFFNVDPEDIAVIQDDLDLPVGQVRVRRKGSAGGHNGIKSIDRALGTPKYARVRMGVGHAQRGAHAHDNTVNWVLGGFGPDQRKQLPEFLADGADAAETIIFNGLAKAQEQFNGR